MSLSVFPSTVRGLTYTTVRTQEFSTLVQTAPNMIETRLVQTKNPIWHWELLYEVLFDQITNLTPGLLYTDLATMVGFLASMQGKYNDFLYSDPDDNFVGPGITGTSTPNLQAQLQVVTDGAGNYYSPLQIFRGGQFWEDVTDINGFPTVYENGVPTTRSFGMGWGGLSVAGQSFSGTYINWGSYVPTQPVTASFNYYYRVHFEEDKQDFEKFLYQLWTMGGSESKNASTNSLKFVSSRIPWWGGNASAPPRPAAPPIPFPPGATQFQVLYPTALTVSSGGGVNGFGTGLTGPGAFGMTQLSFVAILSDSPHLTFSGWSGPTNIPLSSVKAVYAWCPYIHTGGTTGVAGVFISFHFNGSSFGGLTARFDMGNILNRPPNEFPNTNPVRLDTAWGGTIASFPYSSITQTAFLSASISGFYNDNLLCNPAIVVYY